MRERIVTLFVLMTVAAVALLVVPRAYFLSDQVEQQQREALEVSASQVAVAVEDHLAAGLPVTPAYLEVLSAGTYGLSYSNGGTTVSAGPGAGDQTSLVAQRRVGHGVLAVHRSEAAVRQKANAIILPLVAIGLAIVAGAVVASLWLGRRLSRPFQELADAAQVLGQGRFDQVDVPHYPLWEAEAIGTALRTSAQELAAILERERDFSANASHQLRSPITSLRLVLEDLASWPETPASVAGELELAIGETDRLAAAVRQYLDMARGRPRAGRGDVDLGASCRAAAARWQSQARPSGRQVVDQTRGLVLARCQPGVIDQVLDILVENALRHGRGRVVLRAVREANATVIAVGDEGSRTVGAEVFQRGRSADGGTGLGLSLATELAHGVGGRLELARTATTTFELRLPQDG